MEQGHRALRHRGADDAREASDLRTLRRELERIGKEAGPAGESAIWFRRHYLRPTYDEAQAVAIGRLVDNDRRTRSFVRLLSKMIEHPEYLSRERYIELFVSRREGERDEDDLRMAHDLFDDVAGLGAEYTPAEKLRGDAHEADR